MIIINKEEQSIIIQNIKNQVVKLLRQKVKEIDS